MRATPGYPIRRLAMTIPMRKQGPAALNEHTEGASSYYNPPAKLWANEGIPDQNCEVKR